MVTIKLYEVASKWSVWAYGKRDEKSSPATAQMKGSPSIPTGTSSYWGYANEKVKGAAEQAYSTAADMVSSALYTDSSTRMFSRPASTSWWYLRTPRASSSSQEDDGFPSFETASRPTLRRNSSISARGLAIMFNNPYEHVRGRYSQQSSLSVSAIRSLLTLVPQTMPQEHDAHSISALKLADGTHECYDNMDESWAAMHNDDRNRQRPFSSNPPFVSAAESASQISEGTIRALRDLALDEAVELHNALRFWSERWERPMLSWVEAGPGTWTRPGGYNHQAVGRKVAQIQAVLARRCASIGELQTHLLRAGWFKGVAQWGVLGDGGEWAAVAGFDGFTGDAADRNKARARAKTQLPPNSDINVGRETSKSKSDFHLGDMSCEHPSLSVENIVRNQSEANIFVEKFAGGGLVVDDPAFLSEWSVEGIKLVRRQLQRAANGAVSLPYKSHWNNSDLDDVEEVVPGAGSISLISLPSWATGTPSQMGEFEDSIKALQEITVTDLPAMLQEVSELVNVMEPIMSIQQRRRLDKLRPPPWIRRNWFVVTTAGPIASYVFYQLLRNDFAKGACKQIAQKVKDFCRERIQEPVTAIIQELWKGRAPFSDREARLEAIESLKKMIRNWLDENHPDLPLAQREALATKMDVTLIEKQKVESMKTFYEINKVIQMSFIEMQYMKKEMLNALEAIDQMMSANDINMNVAAITPVAMLVYVSSRVFRFVYYAMLKLGTSRDETYTSLRSILTDVERLLVMRDNPPQPPPLPGRQPRKIADAPINSTVLNPDDLGMLMLLLHGCRQILWKEQHRFRSETIRSVSEDLAELAGERGPVSVQQQLLILSRMSRTYPFLKVISTGNVGRSGLIH